MRILLTVAAVLVAGGAQAQDLQWTWLHAGGNGDTVEMAMMLDEQGRVHLVYHELYLANWTGKWFHDTYNRNANNNQGGWTRDEIADGSMADSWPALLNTATDSLGRVHTVSRHKYDEDVHPPNDTSPWCDVLYEINGSEPALLWTGYAPWDPRIAIGPDDLPHVLRARGSNFRPGSEYSFTYGYATPIPEPGTWALLVTAWAVDGG